LSPDFVAPQIRRENARWELEGARFFAWERAGRLPAKIMRIIWCIRFAGRLPALPEALPRLAHKPKTVFRINDFACLPFILSIFSMSGFSLRSELFILPKNKFCD